MNEEQIKNKVMQSAPVSDFRWLKSVGSTNDEAIRWADEGAPDFALVAADEQTKGRGRFDRRWVTRPSAALAFSLIIKPSKLEIENLALFAPLCGLAVHDALINLYPLDCEIKWPNDILINRKKCCGILVEAAWLGETLNGIVAGIGINISPESLPPAELQQFPAVCLEGALGREIDRLDVLCEVIHQIKNLRSSLGSPEFFARWQEFLAFKGEQVRIVQSEKQSIIGIEKGIDELGRLVLQLEDGFDKAFEVGDVHLRPLE